MSKKIKLLLLTLNVVVFSFIFTVKVDAAVFHRGNKNIHTYEFGLSGSAGTNYNKTVDGAIAYCPEFFRSAPSDGGTVNYFGSIYSRDNYVAGQIIRMGRDRYSGETEYMYISQTLNCYYKYSKSYLGACNDSVIKNLLNEAVGYVNKYKFSSGSSKYKLPAVSVKSSSANLEKTDNSTNTNATYVSEAITVKGLTNTNFGSVGTKNTSSTKPSYKVALSSSVSGSGVKLCKNEAGTSGCISNGGSITANGTYYLIVTKGGINGGSASVKITGTNSSSYPSAKRWQSGDTQRFVTYTANAKVNRDVSASSKFRYAPAERYSVAIEKVDDTGETLPGASLRLFTAADENGKNNTVTLCETSASDQGASCSKTGIVENDSSKYTTGRYICYSESTTPNGYSNIATHCDPINLGNKKYYYKIDSTSGDETVTSEADYNKAMSYTQGTDLMYSYHTGSGTAATDYTYTAASKLYKYVYSDGRPIEYKETDELYKHVETVGEDTVTSWYIEDPNTGTRINIEVTEIDGTPVCYNETAGVTTDTDYCSGAYQFTEVAFSKGNATINVGNALNFVNISKRAITGEDEVPGATLAIYKADANGNCSTQLATSKRFVYSPFVESDSGGGDEGTDDGDSPDDQGTTPSGGGSDVDDHDTDEGNDEGSDIASSGLMWVSSNTSATVYGLDAGNYCLQEEVPPKGYKVSPTVVKFTMNESGEISNVSKDYYDEETKTLIIRDDYTSISISKADMATTKEIPGAKLKICAATKNDKGNYVPVISETGEEGGCLPDTLADGTEATWTSGTEPHKVIGLAAGTYFLVETTAPNGYDTAESILFVLNEDGTLTDINGKSLADNKITMYDDVIKVPNTAANTPLIISGLGALLIAGSIGGYIWVNRKKMNSKKENISK